MSFYDDLNLTAADDAVRSAEAAANFFRQGIDTGYEFNRAALESTEVYQKGLLRIVDEGGVLGVINTVSGKKYLPSSSSLSDVIADAAAYGVSEFDEIKAAGRLAAVTGEALDQSQYGRLSDLVRLINTDVLGASSGSAGEAIRRAAGISDDLIGQNIVIERFGFEKAKDLGETDALQTVIKDLSKEMRDNNKFLGNTKSGQMLPGLLNIQKDASVLLRFRIGDKYLTEDQIQKILVRTGSAVLDPKKIVRSLGVSDEEDILATIGTDFAKASKRVKAHTSARNLVESQEDVDSLISFIQKTARPGYTPKTLDDAFLIYDTSLESILKTFGAQDMYSNEVISKAAAGERAAISRRRQGIRIATKSYTKDVGQNFFRQELRRTGVADTELDRVMSFIQDALVGDQGFITRSIKSGNVNDIGVKSIVEHLESVSGSAGITEGQMRGIRETFTDALKKTQDGSMFMSDIVFRHRASTLQDNIFQAQNNLDALLGKASLSAEEKILVDNLQKNINGWQDEFSRIAIGDPILKRKNWRLNKK
jgi:hypothetical protein